MLRKIRISLAVIFFTLITLLFLDFTGTLHAWFGLMAKIQFLPAVLALNAVVIVLLVLLTLFFGRIYCSVICPMGVFQDVAAWLGRRGKKLPYTFSPAKSWLRYGLLAVLVIAIVAGVSAVVALLDPYGAYGRIANTLFLPVWQWSNNLLAHFAERVDSYAFYRTDILTFSLPTFIIAAVTFVVVAILAWRNGRTYCNTICPVGTLLGLLSQYSLFQIRIDDRKCNKCNLCARNCKAACINSNAFEVDNSRCVSCMNCIDKCSRDAVGYRFGLPNIGKKKHITIEEGTGNEAKHALSSTPHSRKSPAETGEGRKAFLATSAVLAASALKAQIVPKATDIKMDGGLADIVPKQSPDRLTRITPAGSVSDRNMKRKCTACQLCVSVCPTGVLRPSTSFDNIMQPVMSFKRGYCRPECVKCTEVCPSGAINKITKVEKSAIQIGHAVWLHRCIAFTDKEECDNCERHCPTKAITMVASEAADKTPIKIPSVNEELCIGCGACEYLCPSRPLSAIYVEGHQVHRII